ncbi:Deaminase OS=Streptomyces microflavus OX=1919 GN=Smic_61790 PE=4 SV=1 [Streptomyces microflavus]
MAKLIYSMITSLDGYAEAAEGGLGTGRRGPGGAHLRQ